MFDPTDHFRPAQVERAAPGRGRNALLAVLAVVGLAVPAWIVAHAPTIVPHRKVVLAPQRVVPQAELPPVEPVKFVNLPPEDARSFNATVPFSTGPNPAARPFRLTGTPDDRARAIDCLAAGVLYEAGDDAVGQRAVAQVVINRARHPAFPKTICGVVFQGSERSTGCQFTFTCDGALATNRWSDVAWKRARDAATLALTGSVFKPVGYATHYHTDWVVPYWQSSLDKVAAVHTHLFFRWTGWWGTPPAFNRHVDGTEPVIAQLAAFSDAHKTGAALAEAAGALADAALLTGGLPKPLAADANSFLFTIDATMPAEMLPALAAKACGDRPYCKFMAWSGKVGAPAALPLQPSQIATMAFSYLRDLPHGYDKALWNCADFKRDPQQCMKRQVLPTAVPPPGAGRAVGAPDPAPTPVATPTPRPPVDGLNGIRRRDDMRIQPLSLRTPSGTSTASPR